MRWEKFDLYRMKWRTLLNADAAFANAKNLIAHILTLPVDPEVDRNEIQHYKAIFIIQAMAALKKDAESGLSVEAYQELNEAFTYILSIRQLADKNRDISKKLEEIVFPKTGIQNLKKYHLEYRESEEGYQHLTLYYPYEKKENAIDTVLASEFMCIERESRYFNVVKDGSLKGLVYKDYNIKNKDFFYKRLGLHSLQKEQKEDKSNKVSSPVFDLSKTLNPAGVKAVTTLPVQNVGSAGDKNSVVSQSQLT